MFRDVKERVGCKLSEYYSNPKFSDEMHMSSFEDHLRSFTEKDQTIGQSDGQSGFSHAYSKLKFMSDKTMPFDLGRNECLAMQLMEKVTLQWNFHLR